MASVAAPRSTPRISIGICQGYYLTLVASAATVLGVSCALGGAIILFRIGCTYDVVFYAEKNSLEVHAGHGLTYETAYQISKINSISEFNIGHFIIAESMFISLKKAILKFKEIINK